MPCSSPGWDTWVLGTWDLGTFLTLGPGTLGAHCQTIVVQDHLVVTPRAFKVESGLTTPNENTISTVSLKQLRRSSTDFAEHANNSLRTCGSFSTALFLCRVAPNAATRVSPAPTSCK